MSDEPRFVDGIWGPHFGALTPDQWLVDGGQSAFGGAIDHLLRLHPAFAEFSARAGPHALPALEKEIVARAGGLSQAALIAEGLHVLPDFIGGRSPSADPGARGGVIGMDLREDAASLQELYVAGLCGLAYGLADIVRKLERAGYEFDSIVVSGGAARSGLVRQIIADVCGKTVEIAGNSGAGASRLGDGGRGRGRERRPWPPQCRRCRRSRPARRRRPAGRSRRSMRESGGLSRCCAGPSERSANCNRKSRWPELVIFDCDGVLVDSEVIALGVMRRRLGEAGLRLTDQETRERFLGRRLRFGHCVESKPNSGRRCPRHFADDLSREILQRLRARTEGRRRRAAGGRGLARARMRRLFERA